MPVPIFLSCADCLTAMPRVSRTEEDCWMCLHCGCILSVDTEDLSKTNDIPGSRRELVLAPIVGRSTSLSSALRLRTNVGFSTTTQAAPPVSTDPSPFEHESLQQWPSFIKKICDDGRFEAHVRSNAVNIYRQLPPNLTAGKEWKKWAAYCALRSRCENGVESPQRVGEVSKLSGVPKKSLQRCAWTFRERVVAQQGAVSAPRVVDVALRILEQLQLPGNLLPRMSILTTQWKESSGASSKKPQTIAGSAAYFIAHLHGHPAPWKNVSQAAGTAEPTLRDLYRDMYQKRQDLLTEELRREWHVDLKLLPTPRSR